MMPCRVAAPGSSTRNGSHCAFRVCVLATICVARGINTAGRWLDFPAHTQMGNTRKLAPTELLWFVKIWNACVRAVTASFSQAYRPLSAPSRARYIFFPNASAATIILPFAFFNRVLFVCWRVPRFFFFCVYACMRVCVCFSAPTHGRCLKLYCDCFASSRYCGIACLCKECCNRPDAEVLREARR